MLAHWLVGLGLGPLVGRVMSKRVSRGGCGHRKSLNCMSVKGWGCVPPSPLVGQKCPSTGDYRLLHRARY